MVLCRDVLPYQSDLYSSAGYVIDGNAIFAVTAGRVAGPVLGDVVSALQAFGSSSGGTLRRNGMVVCPLSSMSRFSNLSDVLKRMSTFVK